MNSVPTGVESKSKSVPLGSNWAKVNSHVRSKPWNAETRRRDRTTSAKSGDTVLVAVNAAKEVTQHALEWALTNVVQPGDQISLLALLPGGESGRKLWSLPKFAGDCTNGLKKGMNNENRQELEEEINDSCSSMMQQLRNLCDAKRVKVNLKVVPAAGRGVTAIEAQRVGATWVVLDSQLKKEGKCCMEQLNCNLVRVKRFNSKILRLNLKGSHDPTRRESYYTQRKGLNQSAQVGRSNSNRVAYPAFDEGILPSSSELGTSFTATEHCTSSTSSSETGTSLHTSSEPCVYANPKHSRVDSRFSVANADADVISEADTTSDSCIVDAISDSNSDDSGPISENACVSPELKAGTFATKPGRPFDPMSMQWTDNQQGAAYRNSFFAERWKPVSLTRPNSANATPKLNSRQGRASTPSSPLSASMRLSGSGRLSFSMREGGSGRNMANSQTENSPMVGFKNGACAYRRSQPDFIRSSSRCVFDTHKGGDSKRVMTTEDLLEKFSDWDRDIGTGHAQNRLNLSELERTSSVRKAMSLSRHVPPGPPPLCSICQHKAPVFGKPPRRFSYAELELATGGFSQANFLAEGGFGSVHRGVLPDGQAVAVKQHKLASSQGDIEFCSEVEVLSCAQHRNVVMLIGYCIEDKRRLLVYEFICNGSLDLHLYGRKRGSLEWPARQKIAVGAARGLRYLHEECRVGCIVHRDMRPNNILLTHDYEPMVGDFGLARWQPDGDLGVHTRVIGTFGYLAPEYAQSGQITEKADVYSLGVVLLELVTGRKAVDINRPKGQQCLTEWARPLLDEHATQDLIDPRLEDSYSEYEVYCMLHAAALCIRKDPHSRPRMSQVLRILEGDIIIDTSGSSTPSYSGKLACDPATYGSRSNRISTDYVGTRLGTLSSPLTCSGSLAPESVVGQCGKPPPCRETLVSQSGKLSYEALKAAYKDRCRSRRLSYDDMMSGGGKQNSEHACSSVRPFR